MHGRRKTLTTMIYSTPPPGPLPTAILICRMSLKLPGYRDRWARAGSACWPLKTGLSRRATMVTHGKSPASVLTHGGWTGAWCLGWVLPLLRESAPAIARHPGHGSAVTVLSVTYAARPGN